MNISITSVRLIGAFAIGSICAYLAKKRGLNPYFWFAIGLLFGFFGIFAIFFLPDKKKSRKKPVPSSPAPVFKISGPSDKFWYYVDSSQQTQGPMSKEALTHAWKHGKINLSTYIWHEEMTDWKPLQEIVAPSAEGRAIQT